MIYSFDAVLRAPKTLHAIELTPNGSHKIPLWRPIAWINFIYFIIVVALFVLAAHVPVLDVMSDMWAPLVYYVVFPFGVTWLIFQVDFDGRVPHLWALSYLVYMRRPKRTIAGRRMTPSGTKTPYAGRVKTTWDLNAPRLHHGWVTGGRVSTSVPVRFTHSVLHRSQVLERSEARHHCSDHAVQGKLQVRG